MTTSTARLHQLSFRQSQNDHRRGGSKVMMKRPPLASSSGRRHLKVRSISSSNGCSCSAASSNVEFDYVSTSNENTINTINDFTPSRGNAIVVGAGPAGALTAMSLARAGFQVDVFERRGPSSRLPSQGLVNTGVASSRTYNIVLNQRGVAALRTHGVDVDSFGVKLAGSVRHEQKGFKRPLRNPFFLFNL